MGQGECLLFGEVGKVFKETIGVLKNRLAQSLKPLGKPSLDVVFAGIDINRKIKIVRNEIGRGAAHLKHV